VAALGPLGRFRGSQAISVDELLALVPRGGFDQVSGFRRVFETTFCLGSPKGRPGTLPGRLAGRRGGVRCGLARTGLGGRHDKADGRQCSGDLGIRP
jgi:hypothetical protein